MLFDIVKTNWIKKYGVYLDSFFINIGNKPQAQISAPIVCVTWIECTFQGLNRRAAARPVFLHQACDLSRMTQCISMTYSEGQKLYISQMNDVFKFDVFSRNSSTAKLDQKGY